MKTNVPQEIYALCPSRIVGEGIECYTGINAPEGKDRPKWAKSILELLAPFGVGKEYDAENCNIDFYSYDGSLIGEIQISKKAFDVAVKGWGCEVIPDK